MILIIISNIKLAIPLTYKFITQFVNTNNIYEFWKKGYRNIGELFYSKLRLCF